MANQGKCKVCHKGASRFDGCSHIECPNRKIVTAQPIGEPFITQPEGVIKGIVGHDGVRKLPTNNE